MLEHIPEFVIYLVGAVVGFSLLIVAINWLVNRRPSARLNVQATAAAANTPAGATPAGGNGGGRNWRHWSIGALVVTALILFVGYLLYPDPYLYQYGGVETRWILLMVAVIWFSIWLNPSIMKNFTAISLGTAIFFLVWYLWKTDWLEHGQLRSILYFVVIAVGLTVATTLKDTSEKRLAVIFSLVVFSMLGFSHIYTWPEFRDILTGKSVAEWWNTPSPNRLVAAPQLPSQGGCQGTTAYQLDHQPVLVNHGGRCSTLIWYPPDDCVDMRPARSTVFYGPYGNCRGSLGFYGPKDMEAMRSSSGRAVRVDIQLNPPHNRY